MLNFRCFNCGWPINLNRDELQAAVTEAEGKGEAYYMVSCPQCRRANKVSVRQMRRRLPRDWEPTPTDAAPAEEADADAPTPAE